MIYCNKIYLSDLSDENGRLCALRISVCAFPACLSVCLSVCLCAKLNNFHEKVSIHLSFFLNVFEAMIRHKYTYFFLLFLSFQNFAKESPLQNTKQLISNSTVSSLPLPNPPSPLPVTFPVFPCVGDWVCICTGRGAVGLWGRKNTVLCPYRLVWFYVYIFVHLVRRGVLVLVGDRNIDRNCAIEMTIILL